jgi:hypothetical protein
VVNALTETGFGNHLWNYVRRPANWGGFFGDAIWPPEAGACEDVRGFQVRGASRMEAHEIEAIP